MSKRRIQLLAAAALIAATSLTNGATAWASAAPRAHVQAGTNVRDYVGFGFGSGPTAAAAEGAAKADLAGNYRGCGPIGLEYDRQGTDGGWNAKVEADCKIET